MAEVWPALLDESVRVLWVVGKDERLTVGADLGAERRAREPSTARTRNEPVTTSGERLPVGAHPRTPWPVS